MADEPLPIRLSEENMVKLYALVEAGVPARIRRIELALVGLYVLSGSQIAALAGGPSMASIHSPIHLLLSWWPF